MLVPFFQMVLSEELQSLVAGMLQIAGTLTNMMKSILPAIAQLQSYLLRIEDLNLVANSEFNQVCSLYHCVVLHPQCIHVCFYFCVITKLTPSQKIRNADVSVLKNLPVSLIYMTSSSLFCLDDKRTKEQHL